MDTDEVSAGIEQLVDHLRANQSTSVSLGDIAGVTEVLLATMRRYFNSIDTTLYSEFRGLSEYIQRARSEISELRPNDLKQEKIPRAGLELEAIVAATENATGTIMDAAEEIMAADPASEGYGDGMTDACMRIFEACSFQDITGQRITKVVATLTYIEERLHRLQNAWGPDIADAEGDAPSIGAADDTRPDRDLLHGPALDGEGIGQAQVDDLLAGNGFDAMAGGNVEVEGPAEPELAVAAAGQDDIDALFAGEADEAETGTKAETETAFAPEPAPEPEKTPNGAAAEPAADADDGEPELDDIVTLTSNPGENASQEDIDALFD